jgi:hypothetical protein
MALLVDANRYSTTTSNQSQITDSRAYNIQYPSYQVQIDSPLASQTTKKEQTSTASPSVTSSASPTTGDTAEVVKTLGIAAIIVYAGVKLLPKVL